MTFDGHQDGAAPPPIHELLAFERLLADLSAQFVNLPADRIDAAINDALRRIAALLGTDRSGLVRFTDDSSEALATHSGALEGVPAVDRIDLGLKYPWAIERVRSGVAVTIPRVEDLPDEAGVDRHSFQLAGVKSNLSMPISVGGRVVGAMTFGCLRRSRDWPAELVQRIRVLADVFANALAHKRALEALDGSIAFERTVSAVLAGLLTAGRDGQDRVIESGLRDMGQVFGVERVTLWQRVGERSEFAKTHRWLAEGAPPCDVLGPVGLPWIGAQLAAGAVVPFAEHAGLPAEASADLRRLRELDIRSGVMVPLTVAGQVVGALSFASARAVRAWPGELVARAQLVGELFASLLARQAAERREQDAQAQAAHAARVGSIGLVAASLVHELTQPLAASLANAESAAGLLAAPAPDLDELRATVADIVADDRRVGDLIQQLRRFLRRGEVERAELDLREVVEDVLRLAGGEAAAKAVAIRLDVPELLPRLCADRVQLQQVLLNLLLNALDAAAGRDVGARRVDVRARPTEAGLAVEVTDTGCGMDEVTSGRVFQPFFTTKPGGMGLGLSISRSIVAAHGGTLAVRSAPGRGSTFRMELPLRPRDVPPELPAPPATVAAGTVFVIDDDASLRRAVERQLQGAGYRVECFASAQAFLDRAPVAVLACIVSDVRMPGLSGLDLQATLVRADRDLPTVFMSGHGDVPTTVHAMKTGAVGFLAKPFSTDELLAVVADALARGRVSDAARREKAELQARYASLTPREREVLALVTRGLLNKLIADRLGAAEKTIKVHRGRVMEKMGARSVADLVRMAERLGLEPVAAPQGG